MGNIIFWIVFVILIIILVINNFAKSKQEKEKILNEIKNSYGCLTDREKNSKEVPEYIKYYLNDKSTSDSEDVFFIDKITWNDLNMNSIYNMMNSTYSSPGAEYLYARLHMLYQDNSVEFYDDSRKLCDDEDTRIKTSVILNDLGRLKGRSSYAIIKELFQAKSGSIIKDLVLDILLLLSVILIFLSPGIGFVTFLIVLGVLIYNYFKGKAIMDEHLRAFCYVIRLIKCAKEIKELKGNFIKYDEGLEELLRFNFLISKTDGTSSNPVSIILDYVRMIFHVDLIVYNLKIRSISNNQDAIMNIYEQIAYIDCLIAVSSYMTAMKNYCRADISDEYIGIEASGMYHPLNVNPVCNDIAAKRGVLITGSNASGKSTFLKTVGINIIYAQSFGMSLAKTFKLRPMRLYSSMALNDNILGEESYYVVESKSLKRIYDATYKYNNVLCIVDEVLRGTNTTERIAASTSILKKISDNSSICFVATHDTELTVLLRDSYDLYYFTEIVKEGNVEFPYVIHSGVSTEGNAIRLLEMLGFDKEIIGNANGLVNDYRTEGKWGSK